MLLTEFLKSLKKHSDVFYKHDTFMWERDTFLAFPINRISSEDDSYITAASAGQSWCFVDRD